MYFLNFIALQMQGEKERVKKKKKRLKLLKLEVTGPLKREATSLFVTLHIAPD